MNVSWHNLQYGWVGFRINGGCLHSYPSLVEALAAAREHRRWVTEKPRNRLQQPPPHRSGHKAPQGAAKRHADEDALGRA